MHQQMKMENLSNIMTCLFMMRQASKSAIVTRTGLSNTTVSDALNALVKKGLIATCGMQDSIGGRRAVIYKLDSSYGDFLGIDLYKSRIIFSVVDFGGDVKYSDEIPLSDEVPVINSLLALIKQIKDGNENLLGIGVGINGQIDFAHQVVLSLPEYGWDLVHLKEIIEREILVFTEVDHRINGVTIAEGLIGAAAGFSSYICYQESSPEKLGIMLNSVLCRGDKNMAGSLLGGDIGDQITTACRLFAPEVLIAHCESDTDIDRRSSSVIFRQEKSDDIAKGMAVAAQKSWFRSVYFIL